MIVSQIAINENLNPWLQYTADSRIVRETLSKYTNASEPTHEYSDQGRKSEELHLSRYVTQYER